MVQRYTLFVEKHQKSRFICFFLGKTLVVPKKAVPLQPRFGKRNQIGVWCNGNTADSGPAFPGSSPGTPTLNNR